MKIKERVKSTAAQAAKKERVKSTAVQAAKAAQAEKATKPSKARLLVDPGRSKPNWLKAQPRAEPVRSKPNWLKVRPRAEPGWLESGWQKADAGIGGRLSATVASNVNALRRENLRSQYGLRRKVPYVK